MGLAYQTTCPICGSALVPNVAGPHTPPWRCNECLQSWWVEELRAEARKAFRIVQRDWGPSNTAVAKAVRTNVHNELAVAVNRGTSLRQDQLGLVPKTMLKHVLGAYRVSAQFSALVQQAGG